MLNAGIDLLKGYKCFSGAYAPGPGVMVLVISLYLEQIKNVGLRFLMIIGQ